MTFAVVKRWSGRFSKNEPLDISAPLVMLPYAIAILYMDF